MTLWTYATPPTSDPAPLQRQADRALHRGERQERLDAALSQRSGEQKPRALIVWRANYLNQAKGNEYILKSLWKDLDLIVDLNYRMDTTALYSDVVLPAASYYEKSDLNTTDCHSYIHPFGKVLDPLYESKPDWEIFRDLAKKMAQLAAERKLAPYHDRAVRLGPRLHQDLRPVERQRQVQAAARTAPTSSSPIRPRPRA